jgi:tetratricopeptide (TPR) repeat protein
MSARAFTRRLPNLVIGEYTPIDERKLLANSKERVSAEIVNLESRRQNKRIEKFTEAIELDANNASAWFNRGRTHIDAKNYRQAIKDFNRAIKLDQNNPQFFNGRGVALYHLRRYQDALIEFEAIISRFGGETEFVSRSQVAGVLFNKAVTLQRLVHHEWAIAAYSDVVDRFSNAAEPAICEHVARALLNKADVLDWIGDHENAIATFDDLVNRFGGASEPMIREAVADGLLQKGNALALFQKKETEHDYLLDLMNFDDDDGGGSAKRLPVEEQVKKEAAVVTYDELLKRFADASEPAVRQAAAVGLFSKVVVLDDLSRHDEAVAAYTDLLDQFGDTLEPASLKTNVLSRKGVTLRRFGQRALSLGHFHQGCDYFRQSIRFRAKSKNDVKIAIERYLLNYYNLRSKEENNPSNGYDLLKRIITQAELRKFVSEQAALLTERLSQPENTPFPILNDRTVKSIIAHGKEHPWDDRKEQGWPYHTNVFLYVQITYRKWINRGLTREILKSADSALYVNLIRKISLEGLPEWLDLPTGSEARARAITDPAERAELEIVRKHQRRRWHEHVQRKGQGD